MGGAVGGGGGRQRQSPSISFSLPPPRPSFFSLELPTYATSLGPWGVVELSPPNAPLPGWAFLGPPVSLTPENLVLLGDQRRVPRPPPSEQEHRPLPSALAEVEGCVGNRRSADLLSALARRTPTSDVVIFVHNVGPQRSRDPPRGRFFILGRLMTVPGPGNGLQRPKTSKIRSLQFFCFAWI